MNVDFEALSTIPQLLKTVMELKKIVEAKSVEKRWLSTNELIAYLPYGKDKVYKMIDIQLIEGEHFFRKENKLVFDKSKIDDWILYTPINNTEMIDRNLIVNNVLSTFAS